MITHESLVEEVTSQARLPSTGDAVRTVRVTLAALARRLDVPTRQRLRQALPGPEQDAAYVTVPPIGGGLAELLGEIGRNLECPPERARYLAQIVLSHTATADPELWQDMYAGLPTETAEEIGTLVTAPDTHPERTHPATNAPAPLTSDELETELSRRPEWSGDTRHLTRTVGLPDDRLPPLLDSVERAARDLNHRVDARRADGGVTFTLRTRSVDAVTPVDLDLADRIEDAVTAVGSGGHPG